MRTTPFRWVLLFGFAAMMSRDVSGQTGIGRIGPSGAQVAGAAVGVGAATGIILYFVSRKSSIRGCIQSSNGANRVNDEKDKTTYTLISNHVDLKVGERVQLKGKKNKKKATFQVSGLRRDYGACTP
jgi:hypothetical protein